MFRWFNIEPVNINGNDFKLYRERSVPVNAQKLSNIVKVKEFDHLAFDFLGSETLMYKMMDANWERYMEERGDMNRLKEIIIPTGEEAA